MPTITGSVRWLGRLGPMTFADSDGDKPESDIQVCMAGKWVHPKYGVMEITKANLMEMISNFKSGERDVVVDYQHGSTETDPEKGKAAGWVKSLMTKKDGNELWATVTWTKKAMEYILAEEYKYISPEFDLKYKSKITGEVIGAAIYAVSLTNRPFLEGMAPVMLSEQIPVPPIFCAGRNTKPPTEGGRKMDEKRIREILKLGEDVDVTDDHRNQALAALDTELQARKKLKEPQGVILTEAEVGSLRAMALEGQEASKRLRLMEAQGAVKAAIDGAKLAPAQTEWATNYALTDPAGFAKFIESAPAVVKLGEIGSGGEPAGNDVKKFIDTQTADGKITLVEAYAAAYDRFPKADVDKVRYRPTTGTT